MSRNIKNVGKHALGVLQLNIGVNELLNVMTNANEYSWFAYFF